MKQQRLFPPVNTDLYNTANAHWATQLSRKRYPLLQRTFGTAKTAADALGLVLHAHRLAFEAEQRNEWSNADFFFEKAYRRLAQIAPQQWQQLGSDPALAPPKLHDALIGEVFVETHLAFQKGLDHLGSAEARQRAGKHLDYVNRLVALLADPAQQRPFLALKPFLAITTNPDDRKGAIAAVEHYLRALPDDTVYLRQLKVLYANDTFGSLIKDQYDKNIKTLQAGIQRLESLCDKLPDDTELYDILGDAYFVLGINQANSGQVADSLVSIYKGQAYCPYIKNWEETANQVVDIMKNLREQNQRIEERLAQQSNSYRTAEGIRIKAQAERGFGPVNAFLESEACKRLVAIRDGLPRQYPDNNAGFVHPLPAFDNIAPLAPAQATARKRDIPFSYWLLSARAWPVKIMAAAALLLSLAAAGATLAETWRADARDKAFDAILSMVDNGGPVDFPALSEQAREFLGHAPLLSSDQRTGYVKAIYADALVDWLATHPEASEADVAEQMEQYEAIAGTTAAAE